MHVTPPEHAHQCESVASAWPTTVGGQSARTVDPDGGVKGDAAAWGEPAIIATCGWPALGPTDKQCLDVNGIFWVVEPLSDGVRFTTFGREPAIEVLVPHAYAPEPLVLPAFGPAAKALPTNGRRCD